MGSVVASSSAIGSRVKAIGGRHRHASEIIVTPRGPSLIRREYHDNIIGRFFAEAERGTAPAIIIAYEL